MFDEKPDVEQIDAVEPLLHGLTMPSRRPVVPEHQKCGKNFTGSFKELCKNVHLCICLRSPSRGAAANEQHSQEKQKNHNYPSFKKNPALVRSLWWLRNIRSFLSIQGGNKIFVTAFRVGTMCTNWRWKVTKLLVASTQSQVGWGGHSISQLLVPNCCNTLFAKHTWL